MLADTKAYSSFAVDDLEKALEFYGETLGLETDVLDLENGLMSLVLAGGAAVLVFAKADVAPADFTILNFTVKDVDETVDQLVARGVSFERYDGFNQDEKGITRGPGPQLAWFKDPAGNIVALVANGAMSVVDAGGAQ